MSLSYYQRNKDEIKSRLKNFKEENPELAHEIERNRYAKRIEGLKQYRKENPERVKEISRKSYTKNKIARLKYHRSRYEAAPYVFLIKHAQKRALKKGVPFSLTVEWAKSVWDGKCALTGFAFEVGNGAPCAFSPSIDKIDPAKGYVPENCRFVLVRINSLKGDDANDSTMLKIAKALVDCYGG